MVLGLLQHKVELLLTEVVLVALLQALTQQELVLAVEVEAVAKKLEIICIAHPPSCVVVEGNVRNVFPVMMGWGKCDEFIKGITQKENDRKISKEIVKGPTIIKPKIITKKKEM